MRRKGVKRPVIAATAGVLAAAQISTAFAATTAFGPSVPTAAWIQEGQTWSYQNADGSLAKGWIQTSSGWYYIDPLSGKMQTGWVELNGHRYYLNTAADGIEGQMRQGWWQDTDGKMYFFSTAADGGAGQLLTGWQWIDGRCYYFEASDATKLGQLYVNGTTPDGYSVNAAGQWQNEYGIVQVRAGMGYATSAGSVNAVAESTGGSADSSSSSSSSGSGSGSSSGSGSAGSGSENSGTENGGDTGNTGGSTDADATSADLVDEAKTKLTEVNSLGWWLPIVYQGGYTTDNTVVTIDGVDVSHALTKVTDDGSIGKLALMRTPGTIRISSTEDPEKYETIKLSKESMDSAAQRDAETDDMTEDGAVYTGDAYLPDKILAHASIPMWDYYLTNYDDNGNARVKPSKTSYDLGEKKSAHASYAPDAIMKEDGTGTVSIMFNYNTEEEKTWFNGIENLALVSYDEQKRTLNSKLDFKMEKNVAHGKGYVGELNIPLGQTNFRNNGRYYVRVTSKEGATTLVPIHVVNETKPTLELKETPQSGKNLHFAVSDLVYGITSPVERVTLKNPSGEIIELQKFDDWYLLNQELFVLYNDKTDHLATKGKYTLTIYANGFQSFSKSFTVTDGAEASAEKKTIRKSRNAYSVDAVSSATSGGSSSGSTDSDGSGSLAISANLIFDTDLLVNAYILENTDTSCDAAEAVIKWWESAIRDAVYSLDDTELYTWHDYVDQCEGEKTENDRMLSFEQYRKSGEIYANHPATAKEVLEDGLLGDIQNSSSFIPKDDTEHGTETNLSLKPQYAEGTEAFTAEKDESEKYYFADATFEVQGSEGDFLNNVAAMTLRSLDEGSDARYVYAQGVSSRDDVYYEISKDGKSLTLHQVQPGSYELTIYAKYYEDAPLMCEFKVEKETGEENPDGPQIQITATAIRKENGFSAKGYVIKLHYDDGTELSESEREEALENYVKSIDSVTVGERSYSAASPYSWSLGENEFMPYTYESAYGSRKDSVILSFSGFDQDAETSVTISAGDAYPVVELIIDKDGKLKTSKAEENSVSEEVKTSDENKVTEGEKGTDEVVKSEGATKTDNVVKSEGATKTDEDVDKSEGTTETDEDVDKSEGTTETDEDADKSEGDTETDEDADKTEGATQTDDEAGESKEEQTDASGETSDDDEQTKKTSDVEE